MAGFASTVATSRRLIKGVYSIWLDREVVLLVRVEELKVPLHGRVIYETSNALRVRVEGCGDLDIFKDMIIGVEVGHDGAADQVA